MMITQTKDNITTLNYFFNRQTMELVVKKTCNLKELVEDLKIFEDFDKIKLVGKDNEIYPFWPL
jgi:hypothetical protein